MARQLFFAFVVAYCILVTFVEAGRKYKTRSLSLAIKEVNEIKEKLINSSTTHTLQWEVRIFLCK